MVQVDKPETPDKEAAQPEPSTAPTVALSLNQVDLDETVLQEVEAAWTQTLAVGTHEGVTISSTFSPPEQDATRFTTVADALCLRKFAVTEETEAKDCPHYSLSRKIGEGGMGVIYEARQTSVDRTIALKRLKDEKSADPSRKGKFLSEAIATAELDHPNIIPIYDLGMDTSDHLFYSMKRVQGEAWSDTLTANTLEANLEILLDVCDAIAYAHSKGVIHRDLKPENVMVGAFGEVMVMDWGLAMSVDDRGKAERIHPDTPVAGTPAYMAPEMAQGDNQRIGFCSDIYLLGAILYEILEGRPPHNGSSVMDCVRNAACNCIVKPEKQGELLEVACIAMSAVPDNRYSGVKEFQDAIRTWQAHAESLVLTNSAVEALAGAHKSGAHCEYAKAMFTFEEALHLWPDNPTAGPRAHEARLAYTESAIAKGDLALAEDLLNTDALRATPTGANLREARHRAAQRSRHMRLLTWIVPAMIVAIAISLVSTYTQIQDEKARTEEARQESRELLESVLPLIASQHEEEMAPEFTRARQGAGETQSGSGLADGVENAPKTDPGRFGSGKAGGVDTGAPDIDGPPGAGQQVRLPVATQTVDVPVDAKKDTRKASAAYIRILSHLERHDDAVKVAADHHEEASGEHGVDHPVARQRLELLNEVRAKAGLAPVVPVVPTPPVLPEPGTEAIPKRRSPVPAK